MTDAAIISRQKRARSFLVFFTVIALAGTGTAVWWWLVGSRIEETDNAYVSGDLIPVSAQLGGQVTSLLIDENAGVTAGQLALTLDDTDARIALEQASAGVDQERREVGELYSATRQSDIAIGLAEARVAAAGLALEQARIELQNAERIFLRRQTLKDNAGAVSEEELAAARDRRDGLRARRDAADAALAEARAALALAREQALAARVRTDGVAQDRHPELRQAEQALAQARVNLARTRVEAPVAGIVARRYVQLGQRVAAQQALFSVVPLPSMYIEANFKETQTGKLAPGQCAEVVSDRFGARVTYRSVVESIGVGTGAVFSRVPVQNAAGNWVKIVQRVPVRLRLDHEELRRHPLSLGMSTVVTVRLDRDCTSLLAGRPARRVLPVAGAGLARHDDARDTRTH